MNGITSGSFIHTNAIIGNHNRNTAKSIAFYETHSGLGLLITYDGSYVSTFNTGVVNGSDHCFIGDLGITPSNTYLTGCIGKIIGFYKSLTDSETSHIHKYLMKKWGI